MSESQQSLRDRYRSTLQQRATRVVELLNHARDTPHADSKELLGELHTLKGEAKMLGLSTLATLVHGVEESILGGQGDWDVLSASVDAMTLSLAEDTSDEFAESLLETAAEALGLTVARSESLPAPSDAEGPPTRLSPEVAQSERWVQVSATLVNDLCESLAALSTAYSTQVARMERWGARPDEKELREVRSNAEELKSRLSGALEKSLGLRLTPIEPTLANLAAHIRTLGQERKTPVDVEVVSGGTRIERDLLAFLREPLLHLCTNVIAHGVEPPEERGDKPARGRVQLRAETSGSTVIIVVEDDGRGIDQSRLREKAARLGVFDRGGSSGSDLDMIFLPGLSTRDQADELAGRGVGLDVVKRQVEELQGTVEVQSTLGQGTTFSIHVPAAMTQERLVVCRVGSSHYGIGAHLVVSIDSIEGPLPKSVSVQDGIVPTRSLPQVLGLPHVDRTGARLVVVNLGGEGYALWVPEVLGFFELLRRPTSPALKLRTGFGASSQLDDGSLVLILDERTLQSKLAHQNEVEVEKAHQPLPSKRKVLVVDDSVVVRDLIKEILMGAGFDVATAENGVEAMQRMQLFQPGLVVSDIEMPQMDGFRLLESIRKLSATLPVILVTARSSTADRQRASALGASAYVAKGEFEGERLVQLVSRYYPTIT